MSSKVASYKKVFEKKLFFSFLRYSTSSGVYALVNEIDQKVHIQSSYNVINSIIQSIPNFNKKDQKRFHIQLLEFCDSKFLIAEKHKWIQHYKSLGYTTYIKPAVYTPRTQLINKHNRVRVQVQLISKGRRVFPIQDFPTQDAADNFIAVTSVYEMLLLIASI